MAVPDRLALTPDHLYCRASLFKVFEQTGGYTNLIFMIQLGY
jgi:hypothetical protein